MTGKITSNIPELLTPAELADRLRVSENTIRHWRYKGYGPKGEKVGRHVRYSAHEVALFLADPEAYERAKVEDMLENARR